MEYWKLAADQTSHFYARRIPSWIPSAFKMSLWFWIWSCSSLPLWRDINNYVVVYLFWELYYKYIYIFAVYYKRYIIHLISQHKSTTLHLFASWEGRSFSVLNLITLHNKSILYVKLLETKLYFIKVKKQQLELKSSSGPWHRINWTKFTKGLMGTVGYAEIPMPILYILGGNVVER